MSRMMVRRWLMGATLLVGAASLSACDDGGGEDTFCELNPSAEECVDNGEEGPFFRQKADVYNARRCPELLQDEALVMNAGFATANARGLMERKFNKSSGGDTLVHPEDAQVITGRFWGADSNLPGSGNGPAEEPVSIFREGSENWELLGRATTTTGGTFAFEVPEDLQFERGSHRILSVLEADGTCVEHGVFVYEEGLDTILTDIDATLTTADSEMTYQMFNDLEHVPPKIEDSDLLCQTWAEKGYMMLYLTARPDEYGAWTRIWLREEGYPFGPMETATGFVNGSSAATYKAAFTARILDDLGWVIHFGYGNAESDVDGYTAGGLPAELIYTVNEAALDGGYGGSNPLPNSYTEHISEFVSDYPNASN